MTDISDWHAANVSTVNARLKAEARCVMHNSDVHRPALYVMRVPIGNELPLCAECCAWWRADAAERPEDATVQPVWIKSI